MTIVTAGTLLEQDGIKVHVSQTFDTETLIFTESTKPKSTKEFFSFLVESGLATLSVTKP